MLPSSTQNLKDILVLINSRIFKFGEMIEFLTEFKLDERIYQKLRSIICIADYDDIFSFASY